MNSLITIKETKIIILKFSEEFHGDLVIRSPGFHRHGLGSVPGWGTDIPQATWHSQKKNSLRRNIQAQMAPLENSMKYFKN